MGYIYNYHHHFTDDEAEAQIKQSVPKVTELINDRAFTEVPANTGGRAANTSLGYLLWPKRTKLITCFLAPCSKQLV